VIRYNKQALNINLLIDSAANLSLLLWPSRRDEMSKKFFLHICEPTILACITFSQLQAITRSVNHFYGLGLKLREISSSIHSHQSSKSLSEQ